MIFLRSFTLLVAIIALGTAKTHAEEGQGFTLYPHVGLTVLDDKLDDDSLAGIGVGYRFNSPWAIELTYQQTDADFESPLTGDSEIDLWHLGALYHLDKQDNLQPFLSFGLGNADYDNALEEDQDDTQFNAGVGVKWSFSEQAAVRGDLKVFSGGSGNQVDAAVSLGLHYAFGKARRAPLEVTTEDSDSDNDGVSNSADQCPGTPTGVSVDNRGCPKDDDGDGVYNDSDNCPDTTDRRARIDAEGCYVKLERKVNMTLSVEFAFDSSEARDEHAGEVQKLADFMAQYPNSNVIIEGHTDSMGDETYNQSLSERRAVTIANMLVEKFDISPDRVSSIGYGEAQPIATNDTREGRQHNRRVVAGVEGEEKAIEMK
jgi:OmpA-OmpF porin, OOP family